VFNVGKYRRNDNPQPDAKFFDVNNPEGERARRAAAEAAVDDMLQWFENKDNKIAILDATNSTKSRRKWIHDRIQTANVKLLRKRSLIFPKNTNFDQICSWRASVTMTASLPKTFSKLR
jgi:6-phosphofructo-2-kinase/fructose-2,6-biphosphatase 2